MDLQYAPPAKSPKRPFVVIGAGLVSTGLALAGVYLLNAGADTNVMGWHANYIIPIGAIVVGVVASSGYGVASWVTGLKIRKSLLWTILLLQVVAYFAAEYVDFASMGPLVDPSTGRRVTFPEYFDYTATHFAWQKDHGRGGSGEPLGEWGYGVIALEILGFAVGSLIVPGVLMFKPYCELCQAYMRERQLAVLPASAPVRKVKKHDAAGQAAYGAEQQQAYATAQARLDHYAALVAAGDAAALRQDLASWAPGSKAAAKLPARVVVALARCPSCGFGHLQTTLWRGQGKQQQSTPLKKMELSRDFVRVLTGEASPRPVPQAPVPVLPAGGA